jgi:hypothetical protein
MAIDLMDFVVTQNITRYKKLLQSKSDAEERRKIRELLEAEIDKLPVSVRIAETTKILSFL